MHIRCNYGYVNFQILVPQNFVLVKERGIGTKIFYGLPRAIIHPGMMLNYGLNGMYFCSGAYL
jgi:hypothetical protein